MPEPSPPPSSSSSSSTLLPPPFNSSPKESLKLITQGAEALLFRTTFLDPSLPCALKIRPKKPWRHPQLDRRLTRSRILAEARVLAKCRKDGVVVPAVYAVDWENGWSAVEWIEGGTVKEVLRRRTRRKKIRAEGEDLGDRKEGEDEEDLEEVRGLLRRIGTAVGRLHAAGVIHGDLTTSNMLLRPCRTHDDGAGGQRQDTNGEIVLIDFGLAVQAVQEEDRAVDLYVLERAFGSTHPREEGEFGEVLKAYEGCYKGAKGTLRKLEEVRMRGRKKSMIG